MFKRYKLHRALKYIEKFWNGKISLESVLNEIDTVTLTRLEQLQCIKLNKTLSGIYDINQGPKSTLYTLERSELWFNRICSYVFGIISGLIISFVFF